MIGRFLTASVVAIAMSASSLGLVAHADTAPGVATTTASTTLTSALYCAPEVQIACAAVGLVCGTKCAAAPAPPASLAAATPSIYCDIDALCTVLSLTVCRHGCDAAEVAIVGAEIDPGQLCTVEIRPVNPFCLLP